MLEMWCGPDSQPGKLTAQETYSQGMPQNKGNCIMTLRNVGHLAGWEETDRCVINACERDPEAIQAARIETTNGKTSYHVATSAKEVAELVSNAAAHGWTVIIIWAKTLAPASTGV